MTTDETTPAQHVPGFVTVWEAQDLGPEQDVTCPRCQKVFGTVAERYEKELLCRDCQTVYKVKGCPEGTPSAESLRRQIIIEGDSSLADALHGKRPKGWTYTTGDYVFQVLLLILLFVALALSIK